MTPSLAMGLPLRSFDDEWAPSQVETTFDVVDGLAIADTASLFKMAAKQIAKRNGYLASFMCTPAIAGFYASGWHLHTSIVDATTGREPDGARRGRGAAPNSGRHYVGRHPGARHRRVGVHHADHQRLPAPPAVLACADRLTWAYDNRAAMMRVISAPGDQASHVENRVGESAANPYLYVAAQAAAGLDGIENKTDPGPISEDPYSADVAQLPTTLAEAVDALEADDFFRAAFGDHVRRLPRHHEA